MSHHSKALAILTIAFAILVGALVVVRHVVAVAGEADAERLNRAILAYVGEKNPHAPIKAFQGFPEVLSEDACLSGTSNQYSSGGPSRSS